MRPDRARAFAAPLAPPEAHRDVVLGPLDPGSTKTVVRFGVDPPGVELPHLRLGRAGGVVDIAERRALTDDERAGAALVEEPTVYAGPHFRHFGHFVAESIHRLYALKAFDGLGGAKVALQVAPKGGGRLEGWALEVLAACGVGPERLVVVDRPTRFRTLHVPRMGRVLGGENLIAGYTGLFPLAPLAPAAGAPRRLYLSRSRHLHSGGILGEGLIERALAAAGFAVVHPEAWELGPLLSALAGAEAIVAAEGSAIHNLDLCGRIGASVFVIGRRKGTRARFGPVLDNAAASWEVWDEGLSGLCLEWSERAGGPSPGREVSYLPLAPLLARLGEAVGAAVPVPTEAEVEAEVFRDLGRYVMNNAAARPGTTGDAQLGALIRLMRERLGAGMEEARRR